MLPRNLKRLVVAATAILVASSSAVAAVSPISSAPITVPEPATIVLFGGGLLGLAGLMRRSQKR